MVMYIVIGVAVVLLVLVLFTYNNLIQLRNKVKEAFSTMDVYLKKRYDLIPSLVDIVKGYAKHETDTLQEVTKMRVNAQKSDLNAAINNEMKIGDALQSLLVIVEKYPDLKANTNFLDLQERLSKMEEEIAFSRRYYNGCVREFNDRCQMFPFNLIAGVFGFKALPMYQVESEQERKVVDVKL
ncbi:MAG: LemA family protein [Bacteroidaceae bacterium]|nr:LemA family protein [Bacteroidaceae bacterium]MDY5761140.1 LemA family protein [Bacteroidaceae bacterium]